MKVAASKFFIALSVFVNFVFFVILFTPLTKYLSFPLNVGQAPHKAEVIVILAYDAYDSETGFLDLQSRARLEKGADLFEAGFAPKIICVGGNKLFRSGKTYGQRMKDLLVRYGIPEGTILVQDDIPGNWAYYDNLMAILKKYEGVFDFNNALVVTSPQNTYRIQKAFNMQKIFPTLVASENYAITPYNWHTNFNFFHSVSNEYCAIFYFWVADRI